jgi:uncharacterized membrane protein YeiH
MILYALSLVGVAVFAASGALAAGRKLFDWIGVGVIAVVTAIGGGTLRDLLLDRHPIFWVADPAYLWVILAGAVGTLVYVQFRRPPDALLLIADALGLAFFTISGAQVAEQQGLPGVLVVAMGAITGTAGGVLRDVLCNDVPLLFRSELYASVSVLTGLFYATAFGLNLNDELWTALTFVLGLALRLLAIRFKWEMPKFVFNGEPR